MQVRCVFNIFVRVEAVAAMSPLRVGYDMLREIGNEDEDLVVVHDALGFGGCHLAVAVPNAWEDVNSLNDLLSAGTPLCRPCHRVFTPPRFLLQPSRFLPRPLLVATTTVGLNRHLS